MEKILYILRHGETELNKHGIVQGRGIDSDLNDTGRAQAAAFYAYYKTVKFDKIYTSTLKRTHQTVKGFIEAGIPWQQLSGFDELAWGEWEGKASTAESLLFFRNLLEKWQSRDYDAKSIGGESPREVAVRLLAAMDVVMSHQDEHTVLICMHGRAIRLLLCLLTRKPMCAMVKFPHKNTTLYKLEFSVDRFVIKTFNNTDHLKVTTS
ncbi:histidine phosphatase family protein [Pedobacter sp.]|uniref:histidine phosphatase family protein n=1 Tax=Pedobacter sp. TaxID=1411316 RepID=UPI003D7F48AD